jgi:hypothetical protein
MSRDIIYSVLTSANRAMDVERIVNTSMTATVGAVNYSEGPYCLSCESFHL